MQTTDRSRERLPWGRALLLTFAPFAAGFVARRWERSRLGLVRLIFGATSAGLGIMLLVVGLIVPWTSSEPVPGVVWAMLGAAVASAVAAPLMQRGALSCDTEDRLADLYQQRQLTSLGLTHSAAVLMFVSAVTWSTGWLYLVGMSLSAVSLSITAPTEAKVERAEKALRASGCSASLREALLAPQNRE